VTNLWNRLNISFGLFLGPPTNAGVNKSWTALMNRAVFLGVLKRN
jgi:hypothetical protein